MRLNADIIFERLKRKYPVTMYGRASRDLLLCQPELYLDHTMHFASGHVYLATVEHLPLRPAIESNVLLVCIGDTPRLAYYKEHATVILIKKKVDFFVAFQTLQEIYGLFQDWQGGLLELFTKSPTIQDVLDCSYPVFECPMFALDASFQYVASVHAAEDDGASLTFGALSAEDFLAFLKEQELSMDRRDAFLLECEVGNFLCVNLFNAREEYVGCLYLDQKEHLLVVGEDRLTEYLATIIEKVVEMSPALLQNEHSYLREILQNIMNEMPLGQNQKLLLKSWNKQADYVCVSVHYLKHFSSIPVSYICSVFEMMFPGSVFFEQSSTIMGLIPDAIFAEEASAARNTQTVFAAYIQEMQLCAGISNAFSDLYLLRTYYLQAEAAIENGQIHKPEENLYLFSEFALLELVTNSLGSFPVEAFYPTGFRKLQAHDLGGGISYLETLAAYLEENMSYAKAARRLYIHRSTLIERISRIEKELLLDLNDPDQRLQIQIILKALQIERKMCNT